MEVGFTTNFFIVGVAFVIIGGRSVGGGGRGHFSLMHRGRRCWCRISTNQSLIITPTRRRFSIVVGGWTSSFGFASLPHLVMTTYL